MISARLPLLWRKSTVGVVLLALFVGLGFVYASHASAFTRYGCESTGPGTQCTTTDGQYLYGDTQNLGGQTFNGYDNFVVYTNKANCDSSSGGSTAFSSNGFSVPVNGEKTVPAIPGVASGYYRVKFIRNNGAKYPSGCIFWDASTATITQS